MQTPEQRRAKQHAYYAAHREIWRENDRKRKENGKAAAYRREYNIRARKKLNAKLQRWRASLTPEQKAENNKRAAMLRLPKTRANPGPNRLSARVSQIRRTFGISIEEYYARLQAQDWKCASCGTPLNEKTKALDHDHETGELREFL